MVITATLRLAAHKFEVGEVEPGRDHTAHQHRFVTGRTRCLPVPGGHQRLERMTRTRMATEHRASDVRRVVTLAAQIQGERPTALMDPQFIRAHPVPLRLLAWQQQEEDRGC